MLWTTAPDRTCNWCNDERLLFTGRSFDQEAGFGWMDSVHPEDLERCVVTLTDAFDERRPFGIEYRLRRHDGVYRWVHDRGRPRYDPSGAYLGYAGSCLDVTEHRETEARLHAIVESQQLLMHDKDALLRELRHRVRNNLQIVLSMISMCARWTRSTQEQQHLQDLDRRIRVMASIQERTFEQPNPSRIDLGARIRDVVQALRAANRGLSIELVQDGPLTVPAEKAMPLCLIASEIISRRLRARAGGDAPLALRVRIGVELHGRVIILRFEDPSDAAPADDLAPGTVGVELINALVMQAGASVARPSNGVTVVSAPVAA